MALEITNDNFQQYLDADKPLVIDFWATWCGPCRTIAPILEELAEEYKDKVNIGKCNVEESNDVAVKYSVRQIPTVLFIKGGEIVDKHVGAAPKSLFEEKIAKLL